MNLTRSNLEHIHLLVVGKWDQRYMTNPNNVQVLGTGCGASSCQTMAEFHCRELLTCQQGLSIIRTVRPMKSFSLSS